VTEVNNSPSISITAPANNENIRDRKDITWTATDPEGAELTIVIEKSSDNGVSYSSIAGGEINDGIYSWFSGNDKDGDYILRLTAADGTNTSSDQKSIKLVFNSTEYSDYSRSNSGGSSSGGSPLSEAFLPTPAPSPIVPAPSPELVTSPNPNLNLPIPSPESQINQPSNNNLQNITGSRNSINVLGSPLPSLSDNPIPELDGGDNIGQEGLAANIGEAFSSGVGFVWRGVSAVGNFVGDIFSSIFSIFGRR
jgi:hypothetical protein